MRSELCSPANVVCHCLKFLSIHVLEMTASIQSDLLREPKENSTQVYQSYWWRFYSPKLKEQSTVLCSLVRSSRLPKETLLYWIEFILSSEELVVQRLMKTYQGTPLTKITNKINNSTDTILYTCTQYITQTHQNAIHRQILRQIVISGGHIWLKCVVGVGID